MNSSATVTLKDMWETRPTRPRDDRKIAGVGAAIARRYDLDPVLVRVGLVAAAFTGVGIPFYVLAWGLLPGEPSPGSPPGRHRTRAGLLVVLGIVLLFGAIGADDDPVALPLAAAAVGALLFVLHRSRAGRGITGAPAAAGADRVEATTGAAAPGTPTPPAWDPLGAAPFAWDLPEPGPAPAPEPPRRRSRVTAVTLATALLAGGVTGLVLMAAGGLTDVPVLLGVVLAVLGGGLVVGAFLRSGRGLIPFAVLASMLTVAVLAAPLDRIATAAQPGDLRLAPLTPAELAPSYTHSAGTVELDLRRMDLTVPPGAPTSPVATRIESGAGSVEIWVPRDADVRFTGSAGIGSVEFGDQANSGPGAHLMVNDLGADGVASGRPIVLDVEAGAGTVEVRRG